MSENQKQVEGPTLKFEHFEVLPSGSGRTGNQH